MQAYIQIYRRRFEACMEERWAMGWHQPCVVLVHKDKRKEIYGESGRR